MKTTKDTKTTKKEVSFDPLSREVISCAIEVHKVLGPGLLEAAYQQCLAHEFRLAGIEFAMEVPMPVEYKNVKLDCGFRADFIVGEQLILELKSVDRLNPVHEAQRLTYMKLKGYRTGLLINFNARLLKDGLKRFVL